MGIIFKSKNYLFALLLVFLLIFTSCSSQKSEQYYAPNAEMPKTQKSVGFTNGSEAKTDSRENLDNNLEGYEKRKIIKTANVGIETKEFDVTVEGIISKTKSIGGYIESSNIDGKRINQSGKINNRNAYFKLRIPENKFEEFLTEINTLGNVVFSSTNGEDITSQYFDTEAHLKSLLIQEERLLEILKKAEEVKDIIELERELSKIRYEIEKLTGTIKKWDNLVSFATLNIEVYEVHEITKSKEPAINLGEKIRDSFNKSVELVINIFKGLLIFVASIIPFSIILIPLGLLIYYIYKRHTLSQKENSEIKQDKK